MKAERRHELRENELAHGLSVARDYLEQHGKQITMYAVVALALLVVASFVLRSRAAAHEDVWRRKNLLNFEGADKGRQAVDSLLAMVKDSSDNQFVLEGLLDAGRQSLRLAREAPVPPDRDFNDRARRAFEELQRRFPTSPLAMGVALSGLATVAENDFLLDHSPTHKTRAAELLTRLSKESMFNGLPFQRLALDRLKSLDETFSVIHFAPPQPTPPAAESEQPAAQPTENP